MSNQDIVMQGGGKKRHLTRLMCDLKLRMKSKISLMDEGFNKTSKHSLEWDKTTLVLSELSFGKLAMDTFNVMDTSTLYCQKYWVAPF